MSSAVRQLSLAKSDLSADSATGRFHGLQETDNGLNATFVGDANSYALGYRLKAYQDEKTVVRLTFQVNGWDSINYLAFGWRDNKNRFWHIKSTNPVQGFDINETISSKHIAFRLTNGWDDKPDADALDRVEVFVRGTPSTKGGEIRISAVDVFNHDSPPDDLSVNLEDPCPLSQIKWSDATFARASQGIRDVVHRYFVEAYASFQSDADHFMQTGKLSFAGIEPIAWPIHSNVPPSVWDYSTTRYLWHSLHMPQILIAAYTDTHGTQYLYPARELTDRWITENLAKQSEDLRYAWYDHGTAMRLITMLQLWDIGLAEKFDARFMSRLLHAIELHGQLLASEGFYVRNMTTRYHNHGIFQDVALMLVREYVPELALAGEWRDIALSRLREQLRHLSVQDGPVTTNAENSFGYHKGFEGLCNLASGVLSVSEDKDTGKDLIDLCHDLANFTDLVTYPDGRGPSYGDSFRMVNSSLAQADFSYENKVTVLPNAGFAVISGNTEGGIPYQFSMVAPSKTSIHKHADNLSFSLWAAGVEWLIDPGFYTHHYDEPFTAYARGPLAHNAIALPDGEYAIEPGLAYLRLMSDTPDRFEIHGQHDAYEGARISRKVEGVHGSGRFEITDKVEADDKSGALLMLHAGEEVSAEFIDQKLRLSSSISDISVTINLPAGVNCNVARGLDDGERILGWSFPSFGVRVPIDTVQCEVPTNQSVNWEVSIRN
ncbi:heparinase II/III-like protein [Aminobacter sp. J15]|nr:heparinase II/III-like protein [Aminobacter sp. J15]